MNVLHIALREVKLGFRNPWAYSFMALFTLFSLSLLLINTQNFMQGYSSSTASMLNLILYLLPLMTLLLGSFSLTAEKEEGSWQLLSTYPLTTFSFLWGKYVGLTSVLMTIVAFGYGVTGIIGALLGNGLDAVTFGLFFGLLFWASGLILSGCDMYRYRGQKPVAGANDRRGDLVLCRHRLAHLAGRSTRIAALSVD